MRFCSLCSGSNGNCTFVETGEHRILVDIGISAKRAEALLREKDIDPESITAVLVTHEHTDHTTGVGVFSRRYHVPVLATRGTLEGMGALLAKVPDEQKFELENGHCYRMGDLRLCVIPTMHDANDPCAYSFESGGGKAAIITDTGMYTSQMADELSECDIAVVESNHDLKMLMEGPYPEVLKRRIHGNMGHLSNDDCGTLLSRVRAFNQSGTFLLGHLSEENNRPPLALSTVSRMVEEERGTSGPIDLTSRGASTDMYII